MMIVLMEIAGVSVVHSTPVRSSFRLHPEEPILHLHEEHFHDSYYIESVSRIVSA